MSKPPWADISTTRRRRGRSTSIIGDGAGQGDSEATGVVSIRVAEIERSRTRTIRADESASDANLDFDDATRMLPEWATWRTPRQLAWHIADTESRYYLSALGVAAPPRALDLVDELRASADHVRNAVAGLPPDLVVEARREVWTTRKALRRLAWHERGELAVLRALLARAHTASGHRVLPT